MLLVCRHTLQYTVLDVDGGSSIICIGGRIEPKGWMSETNGQRRATGRLTCPQFRLILLLLKMWLYTFHCIASHHAHRIVYHITSHHTTSNYSTLHHITSHTHHITSHQITSHRITSHHITSHHITSHHITLHYITLHYSVNLTYLYWFWRPCAL